MNDFDYRGVSMKGSPECGSSGALADLLGRLQSIKNNRSKDVGVPNRRACVERTVRRLEAYYECRKDPTGRISLIPD